MIDWKGASLDEVLCKETMILIQAIVNGETEQDISTFKSRIELNLVAKLGLKYHVWKSIKNNYLMFTECVLCANFENFAICYLNSSLQSSVT